MGKRAMGIAPAGYRERLVKNISKAGPKYDHDVALLMEDALGKIKLGMKIAIRRRLQLPKNFEKR